MKHIRLKTITQENNVYAVVLGNATRHEFSSKREALSFLSETNKFLTKQLYELRNIYLGTWMKYNQAWGYFMSDRFYKISTKVSHERTITDSISLIDTTFQRVVDKATYGNGNHFTFVGMRSIGLNLKQIIGVLNEYSKSKSHTADLFEFDVLQNRIEAVEIALSGYGQLRSIKKISKKPLHGAKETLCAPNFQQYLSPTKNL